MRMCLDFKSLKSRSVQELGWWLAGLQQGVQHEKSFCVKGFKVQIKYKISLQIYLGVCLHITRSITG